MPPRALSLSILTFLAASGFAAAENVPSEIPSVGAASPVTAESLMKINEADLKELYLKSEPGDIPDGEAAGVASSDPGTGWGGFTSAFFGALWQGKTFDRAKGTLRNRTAVGEIADAAVGPGASLLDGKPSIILDYGKGGNLLARGVRDEIRLVAPGVYLGIAYLRFPPLIGKHRKWLYFALDFNPKAPADETQAPPAAEEAAP